MDKKIDVVRGYYYLVPLWFLIESYLFAGIRAGVVAGDSTLGRLAFYGVEATIASGFWFGKRWAPAAALFENMAYLVAACRFVLIVPLEIAMTAETTNIAPAGEHYARALPGVLWSMAAVVISLYRSGYLKFGAPADAQS